MKNPRKLAKSKLKKIIKIGGLGAASATIIYGWQPALVQANFSDPSSQNYQAQNVDSALPETKVGRIRVVNNTPNDIVITLYAPKETEQFLNYWFIQPGESYFLGNEEYDSNWGIQLDGGRIWSVGKVANWNNGVFETLPAKMKGPEIRLESDIPSEDPSVLEREGNNLINLGNRRRGLIVLGQAANVYRSNNQRFEEQRVRERMRQAWNNR